MKTLKQSINEATETRISLPNPKRALDKKCDSFDDVVDLFTSLLKNSTSDIKKGTTKFGVGWKFPLKDHGPILPYDQRIVQFYISGDNKKPIYVLEVVDLEGKSVAIRLAYCKYDKNMIHKYTLITRAMIGIGDDKAFEWGTSLWDYIYDNGDKYNCLGGKLERI